MESLLEYALMGAYYYKVFWNESASIFLTPSHAYISETGIPINDAKLTGHTAFEKRQSCWVNMVLLHNSFQRSDVLRFDSVQNCSLTQFLLFLRYDIKWVVSKWYTCFRIHFLWD